MVSREGGSMVEGEAGDMGQGETSQGLAGHEKGFHPYLKGNGEPKRFLEGEIKGIIFEFRNNNFGYDQKNEMRVDGSLVDGAYGLSFRHGSFLYKQDNPERLRTIQDLTV